MSGPNTLLYVREPVSIQWWFQLNQGPMLTVLTLAGPTQNTAGGHVVISVLGIKS